MTKEQIKKDLKKAVEKSLGIKIKDVHLEHPADFEHGDYATNVALTLAKEIKKPPMEIAQEIAHAFPKEEYLEKVEVVKVYGSQMGSRSYQLTESVASFRGYFARVRHAEAFEVPENYPIIMNWR